MALWIEIHMTLVFAYRDEPRSDELIDRVYRFAKWSWDSANDDLRTAVACAFYEHLPTDAAVAGDLPRRMSQQLFDELDAVFRYFLSDEEFDDCRASFRERAANVRLQAGA